MGAYVVEGSDITQIRIDKGTLLWAKLIKGAFVLSSASNQKLLASVNVNSPTLTAELETLGRRIPYDTLTIAFNHVTCLTKEDAVTIAAAVTGTPITSVLVNGKCFTDAAFIIDFVVVYLKQLKV